MKLLRPKVVHVTGKTSVNRPPGTKMPRKPGTVPLRPLPKPK